MEIPTENYIDLLDESFRGIKNSILRCATLGFPWEASKIFTKESKGKAIAHVALLECTVLIHGQRHHMGALHAVCTQTAYRGQGLATDLILESLRWTETRCQTVFLFTEIPAFYERLSFQRVPEHRFHLRNSLPTGSESLRQISAPRDNNLFLRYFRERTPLSNRVWVEDNGLIAAFNALFSDYPNYSPVYYSPLIDGFICYYIEGRTLHLLDIVAAKMPSLEVILAHLPNAIDDIYFYFSPDRLTDQATPGPYVYDNGHLMVYGSWEVSSPFMVSPLSRC